MFFLLCDCLKLDQMFYVVMMFDVIKHANDELVIFVRRHLSSCLYSFFSILLQSSTGLAINDYDFRYSFFKIKSMNQLYLLFINECFVFCIPYSETQRSLLKKFQLNFDSSIFYTRRESSNFKSFKWNKIIFKKSGKVFSLKQNLMSDVCVSRNSEYIFKKIDSPWISDCPIFNEVISIWQIYFFDFQLIDFWITIMIYISLKSMSAVSL